MFDLNLKSRQPLYEQLVDKFKQLIINGVLVEHEKLPSIRQLSTELALNPNTIQKAYRELESLGLIYSIPGKGSFISKISTTETALKLEKVKSEIKLLVNEAIFLGLSKEESLQFIEQLYEKKGE